MNTLHAALRLVYFRLFPRGLGLSERSQAMIWAIIGGLQVLFWIFFDMVIMLILQFMGLEQVLGTIGLVSFLLGWVLILLAVGIVYVHRNNWAWMFVAMAILGWTLSWIFWGSLMIGLQAATDPAILEQLRRTPLFK